jgi:hypothetical protein
MFKKNCMVYKIAFNLYLGIQLINSTQHERITFTIISLFLLLNIRHKTLNLAQKPGL